MGRDKFDDQIDGQMSLNDLFSPPERLFAVSRVFARARKNMNLAEQKTLVYALSQLQFTGESKGNIVYMDRKTLANIIGIHSDPNHEKEDIIRSVGEISAHSFIKIADKDLDLYDSGTFITRLTVLKDRVRLKFEEEYLSLFTGLSTNYITMWSSDIFQMTTKRSVQFYEFLRQNSDSREQVNNIGLGVKALKEMFDIPKESYMREKGGFNRTEFEKKVIDPVCADLQKCRMINLVIQSDGKPYEKVYNGKRVSGYRFYWTMSEYPAIATANEVKEIQENVDKNPEILKVAKDIIKGNKKTKKNDFNDFKQNEYDFDELEKKLISN